MDLNNTRNNTNVNVADGDNPRRSACDRCRGHKLRCVRPSDGAAVPAESNNNYRTTAALPPCERCVRAGAECLRTLHPRRASIRMNGYYERSSLSSSSLSPTAIYRRSADVNNRTAAAAASGGHAFRDPVQRAVGSSHVSRRQREHPTSFEASPANASVAMSGSFPMSTAAADNNDDAVLEHSISLELGSFDLEMHNFNPAAPDHELALESDVNLAQQLFDPSAGTTKSKGAPEPHHQDATVTTQPTWGGRDESLGQLSSLSSELLKCFSKLEDRRPLALEDILAYSTPAKAQSGPGVAKNIIGVLLESSQFFLETLEHLDSLTPPTQDEQQQQQQQPPSPSDSSDYSYLDSPPDDEVDFFSSDSTASTHTPFPTYGIHDNVVNDSGGDQPSSSIPATAAATTTNFSSGHHLPHGSFSLPAAFTIMTCYMWLLQGYEVVFAAIQNSLQVQQRQDGPPRGDQTQQQQHMSQAAAAAPPPPLLGHGSKTIKTDNNTKRSGPPLVLPNIQFGGFGLDNHPNLQIEMLMHVSCQMMHKIEAILGIDTLAAGISSSSSDLRCAPALLHTYLRGGDSLEPGRSTIVRGMIKTIRQILNSEHS